MENIREKLEAEISREIEHLSHLTPGSEEYDKATKGLAELYRLTIDEDKVVKDAFGQQETRDYEFELKQKAIEEQHKDRWVQIGLGTAGIVLPLIFYGIWMRQGLTFEKTGAITSSTFKGLIAKFRPTR
jgi:hypothetical protein